MTDPKIINWLAQDFNRSIVGKEQRVSLLYSLQKENSKLHEFLMATLDCKLRDACLETACFNFDEDQDALATAVLARIKELCEPELSLIGK